VLVDTAGKAWVGRRTHCPNRPWTPRVAPPVAVPSVSERGTPRRAVGLHAPSHGLVGWAWDPAHRMSIPVPEVYAGSPGVPGALPVWGGGRYAGRRSRHGEWDQTRK